ncbi:FHA domain-containing protein [Desulfosarcina ovata]|uniref:FHA domain-containing protein n=1 Tax=Desulfosarcina ovata TaxID=83564 RepID=UPI0012D3602C|nr:FHA domain-containing protein [Desulfosarcina ovata]
MINETAPAVLDIALPNGTHLEFTRNVTIGRHSDCEICIREEMVSRYHADLFWENGQWWIKDRQSANGIFIDGQRIERAVLFGTGQIRLGASGPALAFEVETVVVEPPIAAPPPAFHQADSLSTERTQIERPDLDHYKDHYFGKDGDGTAGEHTMMVRRAYAEVRKKQRITYGLIIGLVVMLAIVTGSVAWYKHSQILEQRKLAAEVFYTMRALEIDLIKLRVDAEQRKSEAAKAQIEAAKLRKKKLEESYDRYVNSLDIYSRGLSEKEKIIMRVAHRFGECEINMPDDFVDEVTDYIEKWQSSKRLSRVIQRAERQGYIQPIVDALTEEDLPIQFFYLPVQESNLNHEAVGPPTRFGIAKGMWQFIPTTAEQYGLRVGPLQDEAVVDLLDERHDFEKSTLAAARYLRDIYTTDAQASGLLVMASYNWGERRVIKLIKTFPEDPRERNFWKLITKYRDKVPDETYDYVFSIFTAAVIGENPHLFGFDFDNPLASAE